MSEQDLTRAIIKALKQLRFWCWRNNAGGTTIIDPKYGRRFIRMAPPGSPDIMGVLKPHGRLFGIEVKVEAGKQRKSQIEWQSNAEFHGARYTVVRSMTEAVETVRAWQVEEFERAGI